MNYLRHSVAKRMTVLGLLLAACIVSLAMQPPPASAHNKNEQGTVATWGEGSRINRSLPVAKDDVYVWSTDFTGQLGNRSFLLLPDPLSNAGQSLQVAAVSAEKGGQTLSAKKDKDGDATAAICAYLYSVATYPYTNSFIKAYAISLYNSYGCQPAL